MATGSTRASSDAIKAGEAFVELSADDTKFMAVMSRITDKFKRVGSLISITGLGIVGLGASILGPLATATGATLKYLDTINDIAERTNASTEAVSRLAYAAKLSATNLEDIEKANKTATRAAIAARNGSEEQAAAFRKMGLSAEEFLELDMDERFIRIASTLEQLESPADRAAFLVSLLGKNAETLLPLLKEGSEGLRNMFAEAEKTGAIIRGEDAKKAAEAMDAFDKILTSVKSTLIEVGLAVFSLGGDTKDGVETILLYMKLLRDWIKENKTLVTVLVVVGATLVAIGIALIAIGAVIGAIGAIVGAAITIGGAIVVIVSAISVELIAMVALVTALIAAIAAGIYVFLEFTELGQKIQKIWTDAFRDIADSFKVFWSAITGALKKGDIEAAWDIIRIQIYIVWVKLMNSLQYTWDEFTNYFVDGFISAISLIRAFFANMLSFIKIQGLSAIKYLIENMADLLEKADITKQFTEAIAAMRRAAGNIGTEIENRKKDVIKVEGEIYKEGEDFMKKRKDRQKKERDEELDKLNRLKDYMNLLEQKANRPKEEGPQLPIAPMPRQVGQRDIQALADSTRGVFDSSDFRGALGIGEANTYAKQSVDLQKQMLDKLSSIDRKMEPAVFT